MYATDVHGKHSSPVITVYVIFWGAIEFGKYDQYSYNLGIFHRVLA
jgi:hypothetical protein